MFRWIVKGLANSPTCNHWRINKKNIHKYRLNAIGREQNIDAKSFHIYAAIEFCVWRKTRIFSAAVSPFGREILPFVFDVVSGFSMLQCCKPKSKKIIRIVTWEQRSWARRANPLRARWLERWIWLRKVRGMIAYQKEMANNLMIYILRPRIRSAWRFYIQNTWKVASNENNSQLKQKSNNIKIINNSKT